ncbi:MAG: DinB family protein [Actinomycetota bacterium]|nr:DinB family protein [Actinomycetota bacterium]
MSRADIPDPQTPDARDIEDPTPDDKDWTWVLQRSCPECGFDAQALDRTRIPALVAGVIARFEAALATDDAARRPQPRVWSTLEYACHVRDVCAIFAERVRLMLAYDDPLFTNWDQDETARVQRYWERDRAEVARELGSAGGQIAACFEAIGADQWARSGRRSNGSIFTVDTLGRYFSHDLVHHLHDIGG